MIKLTHAPAGRHWGSCMAGCGRKATIQIEIATQPGPACHLLGFCSACLAELANAITDRDDWNSHDAASSGHQVLAPVDVQAQVPVMGSMRAIGWGRHDQAQPCAGGPPLADAITDRDDDWGTP